MILTRDRFRTLKDQLNVIFWIELKFPAFTKPSFIIEISFRDIWLLKDIS